MRQRDTLSPFGLPVVSTQLDTFHPEKGNDYLEIWMKWKELESIDEFVFSILKCMYDIPLVVFHLGGGDYPSDFK